MTGPVRRAGRVVAAVVLAVLATAVPAAGVGAQSEDGQQLFVRAIDGRDPDNVRAEFVYDGPRQTVPDLVVRENGEVVETTTPVRLDEAEEFGIVLAIDTSGSMTDNAAFERAQDAAKEFIANKEANDQVAVVGFGGSVSIAQRFTTDADALTGAIDGLGVGEGTALYDAVVESVNLFEGTDLVPNIVLLTDGSDSASETTADVARSLLDESGALLYGIALETEELSVEALEELTSATGGDVLTATEPADLAGLYDDAQERLRQQYTTSFVSETDAEGPAELTFTIGTTTTDASFTPGARLDAASQVEPVEVNDRGGVEALQSEAFVWVAVVLVLLAIAAGVWAIGTSIVRDRPRLDRVLQPYSDGFVAPDEDDEGRLATSAILQRAVELTGGFAARRGLLERVEDKLERANLPFRAAEAIFFWIAGSVVLALLGGVLAGSVAASVAVIVLAVLAPPAVVNFLAFKRRREFHEQLPDMLALLASTLRSGYSLMQGVEAAAHEVADPMRRELQRVITEARLGMPLEQALEGVAARFASRDFEWATMAITIQRSVGGNLAELLDTVAETMTQRERLRRDIKSLTAEGRISAIVLGILPVAIGVAIYTLNPEYMESFFDETIGLIMLVGSLVLMGIGFVWMYKLIDIEV